MFLLKKLIGAALLPLPFCLWLMISGLVLLWLTRRQRAGKVLLSSGVLLLTLFSLDPFPNALLRPLEHSYPQLDVQSISDRSAGEVKWVVVLGGGHASDMRVPLTAQISGNTLTRLVEGVRLHRELPGTKLILSGGQVYDPLSVAEVMSDVARQLGVEENNIILDPAARDTEEEAQVIHKIVGRDRFILVTSASHMPRSMALFIKQGMDPIAAPTDQMVKDVKNLRWNPIALLPNSGGLVKAERAIYEYLGLAWAKLRGGI